MEHLLWAGDWAKNRWQSFYRTHRILSDKELKQDEKEKLASEEKTLTVEKLKASKRALESKE